jgi:hypothetical protein
MNKIFPKIIDLLIFFTILMQAFIYYLNSMPSKKVFNQKKISVENFSSIILSNSGVTKIGSEKLNKIDESKIYLEGKSYLENKDYKIYGKNISIDLEKEMSTSKEDVEIINSMGVLNAEGFKNFDSEGKIFFDGDITFKSYE